MAAAGAGAASKVDPTQLYVTVDVVRGKKLYSDPDAPLTLSAVVTINAEATDKHGPLRFATSKKDETTDPFYNDSREFVIPASLEPTNSAACTLKSIEFAVSVYDHNYDVPRPVGVGKFVVPTAANGKGEISLDLSPPPPDAPGTVTDGSVTVPDPSVPRGNVLFRYKVIIPKPKVVDVTLDVELAEKPLFSSRFSLLPPTRGYIWYSLFGEASFRDAVLSGVLSSFKDEKQDKKLPTKTAADIVVNKWKCRRSHQVMTKLRICAEQLRAEPPQGPPFVIDAAAETARKLAWKEVAVLREDMSAKSPKIQEALDRMWLHYCCDTDVNSTSHITFDQRTKMLGTAFGRPHYEALRAALLLMVAPGLALKDADAMARLDFDNDPVVNPAAPGAAKDKAEKEKAAAAPVTPVASGAPPVGALFASTNPTSPAASGAAAAAATAAAAPALTVDPRLPPATQATLLLARELEAIQLANSGQAAVSSSVASEKCFVFQHVLRTHAAWWCETLTDAEFVVVIKSLAPAVAATRTRVGFQGGAASMLGGPLDVSKRRKSSQGKDSGALSAR